MALNTIGSASVTLPDQRGIHCGGNWRRAAVDAIQETSMAASTYQCAKHAMGISSPATV